jgi:aryl-alcohol dehydrogenase-like predicted oxidoreductase
MDSPLHERKITMNMRRREFLIKSIAGVGGALVGCRFSFAQRQLPQTYDPYEWVPLGKTGIKVTRVGFGTGMRGGNRQSNQTRLGKEKFEGLLRESYERGVRLFDAADLYGTHPYLGRALQEMPRKNYALVSKIWWRRGGIPDKQRPDADVVVQRFLRELRTDYVDLVLLHCVVSESWPDELSDQMEILAKLKKKGIVRAHGVSCHSFAALKACVDESWVDSVHARINPYAVKMDVRDVQDVPKVVNVLKQLREQGKGVVGMKIIGEGRFRDSDEKRDASVRFALTSGCVDTMVVGFEKTKEIDDLAARVRKVPAAKEQVNRMIHRPAQVA